MALQLRDELTRALLARLSLFAATMDRDAVLAPEAVWQARELMSCVADPARDPQAVGAVAGLYRARSILLTGEAAAEALAVADALQGLAGPGDDEEAVDDRPDEPAEETWARLAELDRRAALLEQAAVDSHGDVELLAQAEAATRATVSAAPRALLPQRASALRRLGSILRLHYEAHGDPARLDEAIQVLREAEVAHGSGHPDRGALATTLGVALRLRYERTNALGDLEEAVRFGRVALATAEDDRRAAVSGPDGTEEDPNWAGCLHNLGIALRLRHERLGEPADLQEAQRLGREAAAASVPGHPGFGMIRLGLGNATTGEERIAAYEQALAGLPSGDPARPRLLGSLADALTQICVQGGSPAVAARAGAMLDEALAAVPEAHSDQAQLLYLRGRLLTAGLLRTGTTLGGVPTRQLDDALRCHRAAATHPAATPRVRLWSLTHWANLAMAADDVRQAAQAYEDAVALLPVLTPRNLTDTDTEHTLTALSGLACDAAACHVAAGRPERALALLELGRGVLLGRGLQGRDDMSELARQDPHTAERLLALRTALDTPDTATADRLTDDTAGPPAADRLTDGATAADTRHVLARQWHDLLTEIRTTRPGFRHFLQPPPVSELLAQADDGPVVVVNVSRFRCDALLLTRGGLRVVPLPELTLDGVRQDVEAFLTALRGFTDPERDFLADPDRQDVLDLVLRRLWDTVAGPVLDALGLDGVSAHPSPQRLWWVPTGPLTLLPLHAAGHHRESDQPVPRTVLDRAVSSYTPTVRALAHTRGRADHARRRPQEGNGRIRLLPRRATPGGFVVVSVPEVPGADSLERAAEEASLLARTLTGARVLGGTDATRSRVLEEIGHHGWLHFCGHGVTEPDSPSRSHLVVHDPADRRLTVADISRLDLPGAELAYLSACGTAGTGAALADEALHLASALQLAGYRHVVGTLWETDDAVALDLAEKTYTALGAPRPVAERSAQALHTAVRAVRDLYRDSPWFWAAHVHVGM